MLETEIKIRIEHQYPFDRKTINDQLSSVNHFFDEIIIRTTHCILKNEDNHYKVRINRKYLEFLIPDIESLFIINEITQALNLEGTSKEVKVIFLVTTPSNRGNLNDIFKNLPNGFTSQLIGFKYRIGDLNFYSSIFINSENNMVYRIAVNLNTILFNMIDKEIEKQYEKVNDELIPLINNFLEGI